MGHCGSLVLKRFSAAVAKEAIEKIPLQFLSRNLAQRSVMCRGESRVSAHRGDSTDVIRCPVSNGLTLV